MLKKSLAAVTLLALVSATSFAGEAIGLRYSVEVEVVEPDGTHAVKDAGTVDTVREAVAEAERITRDGLCVLIKESSELAAVCYPTMRLVRIRIVKIWL